MKEKNKYYLKQEIYYNSKLKKEKVEAMKRKVQEKVQSEKISRFEDFLERKTKKELQENKIARKKEAALLSIKEKVC